MRDTRRIICAAQMQDWIKNNKNKNKVGSLLDYKTPSFNTPSKDVFGNSGSQLSPFFAEPAKPAAKPQPSAVAATPVTSWRLVSQSADGYVVVTDGQSYFKMTAEDFKKMQPQSTQQVLIKLGLSGSSQPITLPSDIFTQPKISPSRNSARRPRRK